jgi:hypothetical protein
MDDSRTDRTSSRISRRELIQGSLAGAVGLVIGIPHERSNSPRSAAQFVVKVGTTSTKLVGLDSRRSVVELHNPSSSRIVFVAEGGTAWLKAGQCLLPGESLRSSYLGRIDAIVEAYGDPSATAALIVRVIR